MSVLSGASPLARGENEFRHPFRAPSPCLASCASGRCDGARARVRGVARQSAAFPLPRPDRRSCERGTRRRVAGNRFRGCAVDDTGSAHEIARGTQCASVYGALEALVAEAAPLGSRRASSRSICTSARPSRRHLKRCSTRCSSVRHWRSHPVFLAVREHRPSYCHPE